VHGGGSGRRGQAWAHRDTAKLLSCHDQVEIMRHKLPNRIVTDKGLTTPIIDRHKQRHQATESANRQPTAILDTLD